MKPNVDTFFKKYIRKNARFLTCPLTSGKLSGLHWFSLWAEECKKHVIPYSRDSLLTLHIKAATAKLAEGSSDLSFPSKADNPSLFLVWAKRGSHLLARVWASSPYPPIKSENPKTENCLFERAISKCFHHSNVLLKILPTMVITWTMLSISVVCRKSSCS